MHDPLDAIRWRDEVLQVLYWYRGEGLGEAVTPLDLVPFLVAEPVLVKAQLDELVKEGYVTAIGDATVRYALTELGVKEGGRRFADEFAGLTGQAHGECSNPNCSCQTLGPAACESRTHAHSH
ncbi:MAG TPA: hypothetical protein VGR08_07330 [Thermomicrobiales bacterium]|nr:hypothetical protein [Thermomicrobiales bacterium]